MTARLLEEHAAFEEYLRRWLEGASSRSPELGQRPSPHYSPQVASDDPESQLLQSGIAQITSDWGEAIPRLAADLFFAPARWANAYSWAADHSLFGLIETLVRRLPPEDVDSRLQQCLERLLSRPFDDARTPVKIPPDHGPLDLPSCVKLLKNLPLTSRRLELMEKLVRGDFDGDPFDSPVPDHPGTYEADQLTQHPHAAVPLWQTLYDAGRFDYPLFRAAVLHRPSLAAPASERVNVYGSATLVHQAASPQLGELLIEWSQRLARELESESLTPSTARVLAGIQGLRGWEHLVAAARQHAGLGLGRLEYWGAWDRPAIESATIRLASAEDVEPVDARDRVRAITELRRLPAASLVHLLPIARHGRRLLCEALGWNQALPLIQLIVDLARIESARWRLDGDIRNCADPTEGILDVPAARAALAAAGEETSRTILEGFVQSKVQAARAVTLIEALAGWNRDQVLRGFERHQQIAIKAFGLLPLDAVNADTEVLQRYLRLRQSQKDARQFGPERQANHEAAVQVGLANLAHVAGMADVTRFEWAMEARLATDLAAVGRTWASGAYELELQLEPLALEPSLVVRRNGATVKTAPAAIRSGSSYSEARDAVTQLCSHVGRLRHTLESISATGESLGIEDLVNLLHLPVARALLDRLVVVDGSGAQGFLRTEPLGIQTLEDRLAPLTEPLRLAHAYDLFQAGTLAAWQRHIVHQRLRQPFKQVFRELYLLTPAELTTGTYTNRFAGHPLKSKIASRLLQSRNWRMASGETTIAFKPLPTFGLCAVFQFPDSGHFLSELPVITTDQIRFIRLPRSTPGFEQLWSAPGVPLIKTPPLAFSEVMRDADLVVSVANSAGEALLSSEMYQHRAEVLRTLVDDLGLPGVRTEGHFAYVMGKLATYRVHLGSAAIHIEPGQYLCVVPAKWGKTHSALFLPFADQGDNKISEVISKVLLLANDDSIRDQTILSQIRAGGA